ncbi:phenylacetic acid degradation operon negative regulatory protein PaaX [Woeseia oceani]|uniref:Phenylacetic acid degradation operon negative regulatory protein PaaX n=1 Tax=Woeseia oceani TaxID=1548547 RepID=A0A193LI13_9GAMM|nr:phenylacetic acid degradation operon negative regulatory protein PaaX [Woeseia oceani]ANO52136.1 phenylacetic acid degradation operon negative regulatory protein PaaX [Woeseia oceani]
MSLNAAARALVDEFRSRPVQRAGSLIITLYGDAIAPRGGTVWIGSLIRVLADFGISERLVRTSMYRLAKDGWLVADQIGRRSYYQLTDEGAERFHEATQRIYGEPRQSWSGEWCLVLTGAVPSEQRDAVRKELSWLGFGPVSVDVMARPAPDIEDLETMLVRLRVANEVVVMRARATESQRNDVLINFVRDSWNLADIEARYEVFSERFLPVLAAVRKARTIEPCIAFQIRTLLLQEYRKLLLRDPILPAELLPKHWHGLQAYQLCRDLYQRVHAAADEYLSATMETADSPLPPPMPEFYERFGGLDR